MPKSVGAQIPVESEVLVIFQKLKKSTQKNSDLVTPNSC